jgi:hypothetical protein
MTIKNVLLITTNYLTKKIRGATVTHLFMKAVIRKFGINYTFESIRVDFNQIGTIRIECNKGQFTMNDYDAFNDCEFITQSDSDIIIIPFEYLHCIS